MARRQLSVRLAPSKIGNTDLTIYPLSSAIAVNVLLIHHHSSLIASFAILFLLYVCTNNRPMTTRRVHCFCILSPNHWSTSAWHLFIQCGHSNKLIIYVAEIVFLLEILSIKLQIGQICTPLHSTTPHQRILMNCLDKSQSMPA